MSDTIQPQEDDQLILRKRLELFLTWLGVIAGALVAVMAVVAALGGLFQPIGMLLAALGSGLCFLARQLVRRNQVMLAIYLFCGLLLLATFISAATSIVSAPIVLLPVMVLVVTLPFVRGAALRNVLVIVWLLSVLIIASGLYLQTVRPPVLYTIDSVLVLAISYAAMLGILFFLLWQYSLRMNEALSRAKSAQTAMSSAYMELEMHAADTRRLLAEKMVAETANELKSKFLANMSHELRTPLNAILNFTHFMGDADLGSKLDEQQQLFQQRILYNADHLLGLINDILDLSKIEAGKLELFCEPLDMKPIVQGVMATASGLTKDADLSLVLELDEALPRVWGDKTRIRQILLNLLSNAAKFTRQGSITVRAHPSESGFIQLAVVDTGIGIPAEHHASVFEEFQQVQNELSPHYQGTGLGLPICKRLVEMHGGQMWMESTVGVGSTFYFTLPMHKTQPA